MSNHIPQANQHRKLIIRSQHNKKKTEKKTHTYLFVISNLKNQLAIAVSILDDIPSLH